MQVTFPSKTNLGTNEHIIYVASYNQHMKTNTCRSKSPLCSAFICTATMYSNSTKTKLTGIEGKALCQMREEKLIIRSEYHKSL